MLRSITTTRPITRALTHTPTRGVRLAAAYSTASLRPTIQPQTQTRLRSVRSYANGNFPPGGGFPPGGFPHRGYPQQPQQQGPQKGETLKQFTVDLTEQAEQGKLDPVIGRDEEIKRTM